MAFPNCLIPRSRYKLAKVTIEHPRVVSMFRVHCESGNSPRSFIPVLFGGTKAYSYLFRNNPEFRKINDKYKKETRPKIYFTSI